MCLLYSVVVDVYCTRQSCPTMCAGRKYEYLWQDALEYPRPTKCSAPDYIELLLQWIDRMLDDEAIFPANDEFPSNFRDCIGKIFSRMFRLYAHIYTMHLRQMEQIGEGAHLNTSFKHFILFVTGTLSLVCWSQGFDCN
ncbi:hypothetical protein SmJEL517_g03451 [Synchytrium microbalum]|uniref:Mob1/phocein n=1 Tax=Synchytrium microbalum TaxID=1806994 RepID=A0A507C8D0_9FUNG|nr:uncharacterized protein SmJEL517_g03451 [Synchytrium microbalum]TPX33755.1 hypothetical protein SmJEL517_g03451 [Synchytrium microbalum]